jgi:Zinc finger, C2H2 type
MYHCQQIHCPYPGCDRVLKGNGSLQAHLKSHYRKENIIISFPDTVCSICEKKFSSKANALRHKKLHTVNHLRCDYRSCYRVFPTVEQLELHQVSHLEEDELSAIMGLLMFRSKPEKEVRYRLRTIVTNREYNRSGRRPVE